MKRAMSVLGFIVLVLISGCQLDTIKYNKNQPEVVVVSEQISDTQNYNIDLTRDDAIYIFEPALDERRLSVTCPNLLTISFAEYVITRIRPIGVMYNPMEHVLRLANAIVSFESLSSKYVNQIGIVEELCEYDCWDEGRLERCIRDC